MASVFVLVLSPSLCWGSAESCADGVVPGYSRRAELRERNAARFNSSTVRVGEQFTPPLQTRHQISGTDLAAGGWVSDRSGGRQPETEKMGPPMRLYHALITVLCVIVLAANGLFGAWQRFLLRGGFFTWLTGWALTTSLPSLIAQTSVYEQHRAIPF